MRRARHRAAAITVLLCWALWPCGPAIAADVREVSVGHDNGVYHVRLEARLKARPLAVFAVITDYEHIHRLHRRIRESRVVRRVDARTAEVFTLLKGCVAAVFCRTIRRVERVTESPPSELRAEVLPEASDLKSGTVRWQLSPDGDATLLSYESDMEPDFWVPALMGDALMARSLRNTTTDMIARVEILAKKLEVGGGEPWQSDR